ncbi:ferritin-like domain-containing protein [Kitasatospora sp. GAS204B]|uniref:ferritin-like domain-containing protein n=1 Tax=unclassified Kitasatospora TaxID=2633591 RepID=UPI0024740495|nr:ferritin-like domain-containing protein [Kitasatospora sp. GAS204B]MDH6122431.1 hypothetical protein [Kitasatospora sp. GAS204B]
MQSPSRRTFLATGALAAAGLLAACTASGGKSKAGGSAAGGAGKTDPDLPLRTRAVAATDALIAQYSAALGPGSGAPASPLAQLRADLETQRTALAAGLPAGRPASSSASPSAPAASASPTVNAPGSPAGWAPLATAELSCAQGRLADLAAASPELARLLASVSAAGAVHAAHLGDTAPFPADTASAVPSPSASGTPSGGLTAGAVTALQAALAGEHTAVYAFGVVGARIPVGPQRDDARACYAVHQARRDAWQRMLAGAGATPVAAAPGYQLPFAVPDATAAAKLAGTIEARLTAVYADLVAAGSGSLRLAGATALRECGLQAYHWGVDVGALPGMPAGTAATATASP